MALFNRLFSARRRAPRHGQENVRDKLFHFDGEQVRIVLFRECDFRGRKLLFDSRAVEKVPLDDDRPRSPPPAADEAKKKKFAEVSDGHGYLYTRPGPDVPHLAEMIFGSVAMSYRGTSYKIHSVARPPSVMCTQVFPCPQQLHRRAAPGGGRCRRNGATAPSTASLDRPGTRRDDSSASCTTSFSDQSVHSTASDTLLVCRRTRSSPLDVPTYGTIPIVSNGCSSSLVRDSGFCGAQSYGSSEGMSSPGWDVLLKNDVSFSCGSLYKRWLRSTSTSLEHSAASLTTGSNVFLDECNSQPHPRTKKLGLAVIIQFGKNQEEDLERYLLEHSVFIEALMWRLRHSAELAYVHHTNFLSIMVDVAASASRWLTLFLSGPRLASHTWLALTSTSGSITEANCPEVLSNSESHSIRSDDDEKDDFVFLNISRFFKSDRDPSKKDESARKFVRELCEVLESVDIKHTNFFMSTLVTAVLTHHLGWVATAWTPSENDKEVFRRLEKTGNPLWGQLNDLYGAIGHPTKMAHTVVTGSDVEMVTKMLSSLTYFIRCNDTIRKTAVRANIYEEDEIVDRICREKQCIPKECYKKYEDHLKEIANDKSILFRNPNTFKFEMSPPRRKSLVKNSNLDLHQKTSLTKSSSCLTDLSKMCENHDRLFQGEESERSPKKQNVLFILGEEDKLIGIKNDADNTETDSSNQIKPSTSFSRNAGAISKSNTSAVSSPSPSPSSSASSSSSSSLRARSEPPNGVPKRFHSVKFNFKQHPQIFTNYMRSKNIELSNLRFSEKVASDDGGGGGLSPLAGFDGSARDDDDPVVETLQTPSNASELEFISEIREADRAEAKETYEGGVSKKTFSRQKLANTVVVKETDKKTEGRKEVAAVSMRIVELPMPRSVVATSVVTIGYASSLFRGVSNAYTSDMVLQGISTPNHSWESALRKDLSLAARHPLLDQPIEEAVAIIANTDSWEVQLTSSHTYVIDKGTSGIRIGMSQLVANMLEQLLRMWKLQAPPEHCLKHIEERLQEVCMRSKALAEMLLATDFCSIELLTSTLQLEVNDIPLLMAVASTHSPQITHKYGLSFQ